MYKVTKRIMEGKPITPTHISSNLPASPESDEQVLQIWGREPLKRTRQNQRA